MRKYLKELFPKFTKFDEKYNHNLIVIYVGIFSLFLVVGVYELLKLWIMKEDKCRSPVREEMRSSASEDMLP